MADPVVHFELPADDVERARDFYAGAFGWEHSSMPGMGYTLLSTAPTGPDGRPEPGAINGGMLQRQQPISAPVITIAVSNIDDALARVESLGGATVRSKMAVGEMGFAAYFTDPEGNVIGLFESAAGE